MEAEPSAAPVDPPPWEQGPPTTLVLVRHGRTEATRLRQFSGRGGSDPGLDDEGRAQVSATADWLAPLADRVDALLCSPLRRTRETAAVVADRLGLPVAVEDDLAEAAFGAWDGRTFAEVAAAEPEVFGAWLGSVDHPAGGDGDTLSGMHARVEALVARLRADHPGRTLVVVSHVTPIKLVLSQALGVPLDTAFRMELAPASVSVLSWFPDGNAVVRLLNGGPSGPPEF